MSSASAGRKAKRTSARKEPIHASIKQRLGYAADEADADVRRDWQARLRRVCKPCWELKYCPYGPLVEQSPLLPPERTDATQHIEYIRTCLETGLLGEVTDLDQETREDYETWLGNDEILLSQALHELQNEDRQARAEASDDPLNTFLGDFAAPLPPIQEYRVPYEMIQRTASLDDIPGEQAKVVRSRIAQRKKKLRAALAAGVADNRQPLDRARRAYFEAQVKSFEPEEYPQVIPATFNDGACNIFGHICPVFFAAEAITETSTSRRRGRYIPFATKVRVVRRDNYTCQHCGAHLRDDEVEFDHKIPLSKGGSSEEQNVRLTCFDCNRDKTDRVEI